MADIIKDLAGRGKAGMKDVVVVHDKDGTIHAEWLIRCKDCRFYKQNKHGKGYCSGPCDVLCYVDGDWFCGDGKPREDGDGE